MVIPGAQRAGSTSLLRWLGQHPSVAVPRVTEVPFFLADHVHRRGWEAAFARYFDEPSPDDLLLAKSVAILYSEEATRRVVAHNPGVRFVVVLREPVARAVSAFRFARQLGLEPLTDLEEALARGPGSFADPNQRRATAYVERSRYAKGIERLREAVGVDRVLVHRFEDLMGDPVTVCEQTFSHLGLPPAAVDTSERHNPSGAARSQLLARLARPADRPAGLARRVLDRIPGRVRDTVKQRLFDWNRSARDAGPPAHVSPSAQATIAERCRDDVEALEHLLGWDLTAWKR
ncbi:MAG TPA: sulfotransferase [Acidimicrobiales bacterium]|nr:sulfotransferase [Acidimicrobiales bacterium]